MYHSSADDADRRNTELVEGVEQLQELVARVTQEKEELSVQLVEETTRYVEGGSGAKELSKEGEREGGEEEGGGDKEARGIGKGRETGGVML